MMQTRHLVAFAVAATLLLAFPVAGVAVADEHTTANETEANETDDGLTLGERLSATMNVQETELEGDLDQRTFEREVDRADDNGREEVIERRVEELEADLENLEQRGEILVERFEDGQISEGQFHAELAQLRTEARTKADLAERISNVTADDEAIEMQEETVSGLVELRVRAMEIQDDRADDGAADIIDPEPRDGQRERADAGEELAEIGNEVAAVLERSDRLAQERNREFSGRTSLPEDVEDRRYTVAIRDADGGGLVRVATADGEASYTTEFRAEATVQNASVRGGPLAYTATPDELRVSESDQRDDDREDSDDREELAEAISERLATALEDADERAHETDRTVRNIAGLPSNVAGAEYTVAVRNTSDGGVVDVTVGGVSEREEFDAESTVENAELAGGPLAFTVDTETIVLEEVDERDERDERTELAEEVGQRLAVTLEEADRTAHRTDSSVRGVVSLPEEIRGEDYTITVREIDGDGLVRIATEDGEARYTTEFDARSSVVSARLEGGSVLYTTDTDRLGVEAYDSDDERDERERDDDRDNDSEELEIERFGAGSTPHEVGDVQSYTIAYEGASDETRMEIQWLLDGEVVDERALRGSEGTDRTRVDHRWEAGGEATVELVVSDGDTTETERIEFDVRARDGDDDDGEELDIEHLRTGDTPHEVGEVYPYAIAYEGASDETRIEVQWLLDGEVVEEQTLRGTSGTDRLTVDHRWEDGGEATVEATVDDGTVSDTERIEFDVREREDDGEDDGASGDVVTEEVANAIADVDGRAGDESVVVEVDLPDTVDGQEYGLTVRADDGTVDVTARSESGEILGSDAVRVGTDVSASTVEGGDVRVRYDASAEEIQVTEN